MMHTMFTMDLSPTHSMKHKNALMIQYKVHKRTSTNKYNDFGGRSTPFVGKNFKTNINANSKQHEQSSIVFMHIEETFHPPHEDLPFWRAQTRNWRQCIH
jgi:hypothetical protein